MNGYNYGNNNNNEWMNHQNGKRVLRYVGTMDMPFHQYIDY